MKRLALIAFPLALVGCAHQASQEEYVALPFARELVESVQQSTGRVPASVEFEISHEKSPRRVYFTALYHQYLMLGQFLKVEPTLTACPQFHHDKIETDAYSTPMIPSRKVAGVNDQTRNYFPELAFNNKFSLEDHHQRIRSEIDVLCEEGYSDNYYKFDNLVTNYAAKKSFHMKPTAMDSVLKIPVFANYYLVKMLQGQALGFQFPHPDETRFIKMTNTGWFEKYVAEAGHVRNNLLKTKMVKR